MGNLKDLPRFMIFSEVAKQGSFTQGAAQLGMTKSGVSQHITQLEDSLQVRLINRTTRNLQLTEAGERLLLYCGTIQSQMNMAFNELQEIDQTPRGCLSITAPHSLEKDVILPAISEVCTLFPQMNPNVLIDDKPLDLVKNNIDVSFFIGNLKDSNYRARRVGTLTDVICATPEYIEKNEPIKNISDLNCHPWVVTSWQQRLMQCSLTNTNNNVTETFTIPLTIKTNTLPSALFLIEQGLGIGMLPEAFLKNSIRANKLKILLPEVKCTIWPIYAMHAYHGNIPLKIKTFINLVEKYINQL